MVDWKKEIKLSDLVRREKKNKRPAAPRAERGERPRAKAPEADKTPFWKISFRASKQPTPKREKAPRDRSFGRKPKENAVPVAASAEGAPSPSGPQPEKAPFWKKEISFGGSKQPKPKQEKAQRERASKSEPTEGTSIWKKGLSFGRKPKPAQAGPHAAAPRASTPAPAPAPERAAKNQQAETRPSRPKRVAAAEWPTPPEDVQPAEPVQEPAKDAEQPTEPVPAARKKPERKGVSVPRPKLPGRPERRASDHDGRPPSEKRRTSFFSLDLPSYLRRAQRTPKGEKKPTAARFTKPELRRKSHTRIVGLKIGASQLAAAAVVNNGGPELVQVAREPLEAGIVVGGELRDFDALVSALKDFFRKHKLPRRDVRLGIANNRIGVRSFEISGIDDPLQLANAVRFRAQEVLPIPLDQAVLDYQVLEERVDSEGVTQRRILLVVAYRELIDRYVAACREAGIKLLGIDLEAFALLRAVATEQQLPPAQLDAALVVVSMGHEQSTFALSDGRSCDFTRIFDWGGASINVAIARALDITPSQAEPIKCGLSLLRDEQPGELPDDRTEKARDIVLQQLQAFARDLVSSLQFYQNQPGSMGIGEIVLTGGTAHMPGLPEELQRLIGVPVRLGDPLVRVKISTHLPMPAQLGSLSVPIGLGMEA